MYVNQANGYWYIRQNTPDGRETFAKLGKRDEKPVFYTPQLVNDKASNTLKRLDTNSIDLIIADPPFGVEWESNWLDGGGGQVAHMKQMMNDRDTGFLEDLAADFHRVLKPDSHFYIFTKWSTYPTMRSYFTEYFEENMVIVWDKMMSGLGNINSWGPRHEFIIHFHTGDPDLYDPQPPNVLRFPGATTSAYRDVIVHPTQKNRELIEKLIHHSSRPGDLVFDPFGGSYVTPRAAMRMFRRSVSCELDPDLHRTSVGLVNKQIQDDPEYGVDWTGVNNLEVEQVDVLSEFGGPVGPPSDVSEAEDV